MQPQLAIVAPPFEADPVSIEFMIKDLARSGLVSADMQAYPISSKRYDGCGSYVLPYHSPNMYRTRIDRAVNKYLQPKNIRDIWWSHTQNPQLALHDTLYIIEGEKKAARFVKQWPGKITIGIGGAWNGLETLSDGTRRLLPSLIKCVAPNMRVVAIFDGDILTKPNIQMAASALQVALQAHACSLEICLPPFGKGVDDWLEAEPAPDLKQLIKIPLDELEESRKQLYVSLGCSTNDGKLILNELNASKILHHYFADQVYIDKRLGVIAYGEISDRESLDTQCITYMQGTINYHYKVPQIRQGLQMALSEHKDLVQELVKKLEWDGVPRLATWGSKYLESSFPAFADEWGRILITGMALRILKPGTKVDYACILIGAQGIGKSTFFEELSKFDGYQFYYAVTDLGGNAGDSNRTQAQMFARSVIVDLAEGVIFETKKASMDRVKQMLTQTHDEYRVAYAKSPTIEDRGFVFVGTTNRIDQLGDATGSRRFLNLHVSEITRLPYNEKLQLLAEVAHNEVEIRSSEWYKLNLHVAQAPEALREAHSHITNVQELVNTQFARPDVRQEVLISLIEANELATLKTGEQYITSNYFASRLGEETASGKNFCARTLSALSTSPTFPYKLTWLRKRLPQLNMTEGMRFGYTQGINNNQQMIQGYVVEKK